MSKLKEILKETSLEGKLENAKYKLQSRRRSGRTIKMLKEVVEKSITEGKPGNYFVVLAHTNDWAKEMCKMTVKILEELGMSPKIVTGGVEVKSKVSILFNTDSWWDRNSRMMPKSTRVYTDNVFSDISTENYIRDLEIMIHGKL
jgi:hypothetical protein